MNAFLFVVALVAILAVLFFVVRIMRLLDILYGRREEISTTRNNLLQASLFLIVVLGGLGWLFWFGFTHKEAFITPSASEHGPIIDGMFWLTMTLILIALVITHVLLFYFAFRYRHQHKNKRWASFYHENDRLEITWTILLAIGLSWLIFRGWQAWTEIMAPAPETAETIEVVAYQFAWASRYSGKDGVLGASDYRLIDAENRIGIDFSDPNAQDDFIPREIHIPKGRPVKFLIRGLDVIHSVYILHFRVQMYATPGMNSTFWFTPTKTTEEMRQETDNPEFNYELACNKICGKGHFTMRYLIVVDEPEDYDRWRAEQESWLEKHPEYATQLSLKRN